MQSEWWLCPQCTKPRWSSSLPAGARVPFNEYRPCQMEVSCTGGTHKSSILNCIFHYKPSIWGYLHLWGPPNRRKMSFYTKDRNFFIYLLDLCLVGSFVAWSYWKLGNYDLKTAAISEGTLEQWETEDIHTWNGSQWVPDLCRDLWVYNITISEGWGFQDSRIHMLVICTTLPIYRPVFM